MGWLWGGYKQSNTYLCIPDRKVWKVDLWSGQQGSIKCPKCGSDGKDMGTKWRAPRLTNKSAWRKIERGDYLWESFNPVPAGTWKEVHRKDNVWRDGNKKPRSSVPKKYSYDSNT